MAKIFNHPGDDYLVLKMFDFYFFKSKSRLPLFEQRCFKTEKRKLSRTTEKVFSLHVYNNLLISILKDDLNHSPVLLFVSPFFSWSFLASLLQLFWPIYASMICSSSLNVNTSKQKVSDLPYCFPFLFFGPCQGELNPNWNLCRTSLSQQKQLKVVSPISFYTFQSGLISV